MLLLLLERLGKLFYSVILFLALTFCNTASFVYISIWYTKEHFFFFSLLYYLFKFFFCLRKDSDPKHFFKHTRLGLQILGPDFCSVQ